MLAQVNYERDRVLSYANKWAFRRNPKYLDFSGFGGDCTNFASQCIHAGSNVMNFTPVHGWYYTNADNRTPSWTGVQYLYQFLISNRGAGPFAEKIPIEKIMPADIIQLGRESGEFYHSLVVIETGEVPSADNILVTTHSFDANRRPLNTYRFEKIRFLHISGVRQNR